MTYSKPEITSLAQAAIAVRGSSVKGSIYADADPRLGNTATSPAYEADE
jgi:hypothetical protein